MIDLMSCPLTKLFMDARAGRVDEQTLRTECALFIFRRLKKNRSLDEDIKQDLLIDVISYLHKFIARFEFQGIPLERCLIMIMKKRLNSFYRSSRRRTHLWHICRDPSFASAYSPESATPAAPFHRLAELFGIGPDGRLITPAARKWYAVCLLKSCRHLSAADFSLAARLTGYDEKWLCERAEQLTAQRKPQERRLMKLQQRRNRLFVQARMLEMKIINEVDAEVRRTLAEALEKKKRSLRKAVFDISRIAWDPSASMVAQALGIPKGTVDTIIARLQRLLQTKAAENTARPA